MDNRNVLNDKDLEQVNGGLIAPYPPTSSIRPDTLGNAGQIKGQIEIEGSVYGIDESSSEAKVVG